MTKRLGVHFGNQIFSIVESENQTPAKYFSAPHSLFEPQPSAASKDVPEEIRITALIQKNLREQKILPGDASLAIPAKDIIFRSFVIPWVHASEVKNVVEFEARKYIPFKLEEVAYTFHPVTFNEKAIRKIRVLFVAARNDILYKYCNVLGQAGLKVTFIEPSSLSLVRVLIFKNKLPLDQKIAVVETNQKEGKITIVDHGMPQFIRDFKLSPANQTKEDADPEIANARLFNEIRISLDYYGRQYNQEKVTSIITVSETESAEMAQNIGNDLGIPATSVGVKETLNLPEVVSIDLLNAFGVSLRDSVPLAIKFDFLTQPVSKTSKSEFQFKLSKENILAIAKTAGVCAGLLIMAFVGSNLLIGGSKSKLQKLTEQGGIFKDLPVEQIEEKIKSVQDRLDDYKTIRTTSHMTFLLTKIPKTLPPGVWLSNLQVQYVDITKAELNFLWGLPAESEADQQKMTYRITLNFTGYAYDSNPNQQLRLLNNYKVKLKTDPFFAKNFHKVELSANAQPMENYQVTAFKIDCE